MSANLSQRSRRIFALLAVLLFLAAPALALALPAAQGNLAIDITVHRTVDQRARAYADKSDWPMFLHDPAHTGYTTSPAPVDNGTIWEASLGGTTTASPVVAGNAVIAATVMGIAHSLNASTGAELWNANLGSLNPSTAAVWNGHVIFGMQNGDLISLVAGNGTLEWKVSLGGAANTTPVISNGVVYVGTGASKVWAYNITDAKELWNVTVSGPVKYSAALSAKVLVVSSGGTLQALNATNGNALWSNSTAGTEISGPSIAGSSAQPSNWLALVTSNDGKLYAFNMSDGGIKWSSAISYGGPRTPAVKGTIAITTGVDRVQALNDTNGKYYWNLTATDGPVTSAALANTTLVFGTKAGINVTAFATLSVGPQRWSFKLKNPNAPALAYGRAFAIANDGKIEAFGHRSLAVIDVVSPDPMAQDGLLTLKGHGLDAAAFKNFRWSSDIDGIISEGPAKPTTVIAQPLSMGKHTISFQVQDDNWTWSLPVTAQVTVNLPTEWPMFRANTQRTGVSATAVPRMNGTKWAVHLTAPSDTFEVLASPIIVGKFAYIGTRDWFMHALNVSTGDQTWSYMTGGSIESTAAYAGGYIYFGSDDSRIYCMDADPSDGIDEGVQDSGAPYDLIWSYQTNGPIWASPAVVDGIVYVVTVGTVDPLHPNPARLYALRASPNGGDREVWHFTVPNNVVSYSSPVVYGDLVMFGANDNKLYAVNRWSGKEVWNYTTGDTIHSSPTAANGIVYFGSNDWRVYAVWTSNGSTAWTKSTGDMVQASPAVSNGVVYVGSMDNRFYALNATTGAQLWAFDARDGIWSSAAVVEDQVMFGSYDGYLYMVNTTTHALTWKKYVDVVAQSSPAVSHETVLIGAGHGNVYAVGRAPDLSVEPKDVTFSLSTPQVGVPGDIYVTITNKGTMHGNGTVNISDMVAGVPTNLDSRHVELDPGNSTSYPVPWVPSAAGFQIILVNITDVRPYDSNPANNKVMKSVSVLAQTEGWRMFQKDPAHTGVADIAAPNNNKLYWSYGFSGAIRASPIVADQLIYIGTMDGIYALAENPGQPTGIIVWSNTTIKNIEATPAVVNGIVYVATMDGNLFALDARSGKTLWSIHADTGPSSPIVHNGTIYLGTLTGKVLAMGATNGTVLWNRTMGGQIIGSPAVYDDKAVVVGNANGSFSKITSFNIKTGDERWSYRTGFDILSSPAIDETGHVYISDMNGTVYKFESVPDFQDDGIPNTGMPYDIIWYYPTGMPIRSTISIFSNNIYLTTGNTTVMSLTTNGELNWKRAYSSDEHRNLISSVATSQNKLFVGGDMIYCLDRSTGLKIWSYDTKTNVSASPAITLGKVILASESGGVYTFANITLVEPKAIISTPKDGSNHKIQEPITFNGSASTDDGVILAYLWDFGDGNMGTGATVVHTFDNVGDFTVTLTVKDNELSPLASTANVTIHILNNNHPTLGYVAITPMVGTIATKFDFTVVYSDPDDDPPAYVKVAVSGTDYFMQKVYKDATDFVGGVKYYCSTNLPSGNHHYSFVANDGVLYANNATGQSISGTGPKVWQVGEFTKGEIKVDIEYVGQGRVVIEPPTLHLDPPVDNKTSLSEKDMIFISTDQISEWRWLRLEVNMTGKNVTTGVTSLAIYWFNVSWQKMDTKQVQGKPIYWINITSDKEPTLGTFGLYGLPLPVNTLPHDLAVIAQPSDRVNVKAKVTLKLTAKDDESDPLYFKVVWGFKGSDNDSGLQLGTQKTGFSEINQSHTFDKKGTYKVEVSVTDSPGNSTRIVRTTIDITVREEGSSEALVVLVVIILVVLAVAFAVPIKGGRDDEDEEEEEETIPEDEEIGKGKRKGKGKAVVGAAEEE